MKCVMFYHIMAEHYAHIVATYYTRHPHIPQKTNGLQDTATRQSHNHMIFMSNNFVFVFLSAHKRPGDFGMAVAIQNIVGNKNLK